jgi:hypothetical protein
MALWRYRIVQQHDEVLQIRRVRRREREGRSQCDEVGRADAEIVQRRIPVPDDKIEALLPKTTVIRVIAPAKDGTSYSTGFKIP